ncbi:putative thiamine pyrophosphokinase [Annulohypoxylon maeteangense]|uniref:putative thiamine pyrophosphokinase n=1 Tax=Annulohypoxylon maeteangense TaxID=1927788 RepID=UPI0020088FA1|nr:putative thiamine pyrophosphokinase [Annulohypoxylon maeteangense]KAI0884181.1 putative thiamine pyrophosphokinase [Annulohypoxylon maeteangense]
MPAMGFLDVIDVCDNFPQHDDAIWNASMSQLWRFFLPGDDRAFGYLTQATISQMPWTSDFKIDESTKTVHLAPEDMNDIVASSTAAISRILKVAQDAKSFPRLLNWPGEKFPVLGAPFPFAVDRAIATYFGIVSTGAQLTIFVRGKTASVTGIWIARRAADKPMYPGMLDNAAGGAVDYGETPFESLVREADEELGFDVKAAVSGGSISWFNIKDGEVGGDLNLVECGVQYVYDLEVDAETVLHPAEAGIDWLRLLSVDEVKDALRRQEFKPSCACVMIDFFVRHGIINAENDRDFAEIVARLHRRLPLPTTYPLKTA